MKTTPRKAPGFQFVKSWQSLVGSAVLVSLTACGVGDTAEIEVQRDLTRSYGRAEVGATSADRFGAAKTPAADGQHNHSTDAQSNGTAAPNAAPLEWIVPAGWESKAPTSMRLANLVPAGNPNSECTLTLLGGNGGGALSNVNRWRAQMGLGAIDQAAMDAIPTMSVLGYDASFFQLEGAYSGMGGEPKPDWSMLGLILSREQFTIFVKMNGPTDLVNAERSNFFAFCASLREPGANTAPAAASNQGAAGTQQKGYTMPAGWSVGPQKSMRTLNLLAGDSECYLILLGGEAGGLAANLNRWMGEVGLPDLTSTEIAALPTVNLFGVSASMIEVTGNYKGMGDNDGLARTVFGVALVRSTGSAFVKMVGPSDEMAGEKQHFIEFVESLEE
jgi:hypothetical protein